MLISSLLQSVEVSNPKLMVIVGSFGLLSNIVGLFLFHGKSDIVFLSCVIKPLCLAEHGHGHSHGHSHSHASPKGVTAHDDSSSDSAENDAHGARRERSDSFGSLYGHPALTRAAVIETAQEFGYGRSPPSRDTRDSFTMAFSPTGQTGSEVNPISHHVRSKSVHDKRASISSPTERTGLTTGQTTSYAAVVKKNTEADDHDHAGHDHDHSHGDESHDHGNGKQVALAHDHSEAEAGGHSHGGGHGHSHGNMNAQGVFLHVLGDA